MPRDWNWYGRVEMFIGVATVWIVVLTIYVLWPR